MEEVQTLLIHLPLQNSQYSLLADVHLGSSHLFIRVLGNDGRTFSTTILPGGNGMDIWVLFGFLKDGKMSLASDGDGMKLVFQGLPLYSLVEEKPENDLKTEINQLRAELQQTRQDLQKTQKELSDWKQAMVLNWQKATLHENWKEFSPVYFAKDMFGFVHVKGFVKQVSYGCNDKIFTFPENFRPTTETFWPFGQHQSNALKILPDGCVIKVKDGNEFILNGMPLFLYLQF
jgi:hypothetical protein